MGQPVCFFFFFYFFWRPFVCKFVCMCVCVCATFWPAGDLIIMWLNLLVPLNHTLLPMAAKIRGRERQVCVCVCLDERNRGIVLDSEAGYSRAQQGQQTQPSVSMHWPKSFCVPESHTIPPSPPPAPQAACFTACSWLHRSTSPPARFFMAGKVSEWHTSCRIMIIQDEL